MKNDPIIRGIWILIFGTIAFKLLFYVLTGGKDDMDDMMSSGSMAGSGTSINSFLAGLLIFLIKFLMIVLVAAIIIGVILWVKNNFFKDVHFNLSNAFKNDPVLKAIFGITGAVLGILLVIWIFNNLITTNWGTGEMNMMSSGEMSTMYGSGMTGFNASLGFTSIFTLIIQVLSFVLVISLIMGLFAYIKKQYGTGFMNMGSGEASSEKPKIIVEPNHSDSGTQNKTK